MACYSGIYLTFEGTTTACDSEQHQREILFDSTSGLLRYKDSNNNIYYVPNNSSLPTYPLIGGSLHYNSFAGFEVASGATVTFIYDGSGVCQNVTANAASGTITPSQDGCYLVNFDANLITSGYAEDDYIDFDLYNGSTLITTVARKCHASTVSTDFAISMSTIVDIKAGTAIRVKVHHGFSNGIGIYSLGTTLSVTYVGRKVT